MVLVVNHHCSDWRNRFSLSGDREREEESRIRKDEGSYGPTTTTTTSTWLLRLNFQSQLNEMKYIKKKKTGSKTLWLCSCGASNKLSIEWRKQHISSNDRSITFRVCVIQYSAAMMAAATTASTPLDHGDESGWFPNFPNQQWYGKSGSCTMYTHYRLTHIHIRIQIMLVCTE